MRAEKIAGLLLGDGCTSTLPLGSVSISRAEECLAVDFTNGSRLLPYCNCAGRSPPQDARHEIRSWGRGQYKRCISLLVNILVSVLNVKNPICALRRGPRKSRSPAHIVLYSTPSHLPLLFTCCFFGEERRDEPRTSCNSKGFCLLISPL